MKEHDIANLKYSSTLVPFPPPEDVLHKLAGLDGRLLPEASKADPPIVHQDVHSPKEPWQPV